MADQHPASQVVPTSGAQSRGKLASCVDEDSSEGSPEVSEFSDAGGFTCGSLLGGMMCPSHRSGRFSQPLMEMVRSMSLQTEEHVVADALGREGELAAFWMSEGVCCLRGRALENQGLGQELEWRYPIGRSAMPDYFPTVGVTCARGSKGTCNQDNFCIARFDNRHSLAMVADGHGACGHDASAWVVQALPYHLVRSSHFPDKMSEALEDAFSAVHHAMEHIRVRDKFFYSGSTATVAVWSDSRIWVAHVGDSRCVVSGVSSSCSSADGQSSRTPVKGKPRFLRKGSGLEQALSDLGSKLGLHQNVHGSPKGSREDAPNDGSCRATVVLQTQDHGPELPSEKARVERCGGEVRTQRQLRADRGFLTGALEIHRIFALGQREPGIAVSRSLGDIRAHQLGVSATPEVTSLELDFAARQCLIIASDGIWGALSSAKVAEMAHAADPSALQAASRDIQQLAHRQFAEKHAGSDLDDATVLLIQL